MKQITLRSRPHDAELRMEMFQWAYYIARWDDESPEGITDFLDYKL